MIDSNWKQKTVWVLFGALCGKYLANQTHKHCMCLCETLPHRLTCCVRLILKDNLYSKPCIHVHSCRRLLRPNVSKWQQQKQQQQKHSSLWPVPLSLSPFRSGLIGQKAAPTNIIQICNLSLLSFVSILPSFFLCEAVFYLSNQSGKEKCVFINEKNVKWRISHFSTSQLRSLSLSLFLSLFLFLSLLLFIARCHSIALTRLEKQSPSSRLAHS